MESDDRFPLPTKKYRWYVLFFHALTLGSLVGALAWILWNARHDLGWPQIVVCVLLLAQMGIYIGLMIFGRQWPLPRNRLLLYFAVNLAIWLVEYWLVPEVYWIVFAYLGQMFGLLPARFAIFATLFVSGILFASTAGWGAAGANPALLLGTLAVWVMLVVFMLYMNHLTRTSQERGELIAELQAAKAELELAQQREAELAVLRERERLARDLHDSLGHTLVALSVQLEAIQRLYRVNPEQASAQVDEMKALTRSSMDSLRRSLAGLRSPGLGDSALRPALQALCVDFGERTGTDVACQIDKAADHLRLALAEALWRVTQEALTNVEKHAQARRVRVTLSCELSSVLLEITDDGVGLPPGAASGPNRFGLRGMRERVEGLGGTLTLSGTEEGTVVQARLPVITAGDAPSSSD
ncbi:MAG: sensor histidine kinase [Anaerolineae bacterium]|jgi:signal transduction histidine kinase